MELSDHLELIPLDKNDQEWVGAFITDRWCSNEIVVHGRVYLSENLPGIKALINKTAVGLITWNISGKACEIVTLDSTTPGKGIGAALLEKAEETAWKSGCKKCWLVTTNDNLNAIRFYQRRGYRITGVRISAVDEARNLKPSIPKIGTDGIPIHDEIVLTKLFEDEISGE